MNQEETAVDVLPAFPTPIVVREIPNFHKVKGDFVRDIYQYFEKNVVSKSNNIFNLIEFQKYFPLVHTEIQTSLSPIIDDLDQVLPSCVVRSNISVVKPNEPILPHAHYEYDITGILVVDCPFRFSGDFVFFSQHSNKFFHNMLNKDMKDMYFSNNIKISPMEGKLIMFPSTLLYYGEINRTDLDKIIITFDIKL